MAAWPFIMKHKGRASCILAAFRVAQQVGWGLSHPRESLVDFVMNRPNQRRPQRTHRSEGLRSIVGERLMPKHL